MLTSPVDFVLTFSTGLVVFTLITSGISKLGDTASTLRAMSALRVPTIFTRQFFARALPVVELLIAVAILLAPGFGRQLAGGVATLMFAAFTAMLVGVLARKEDVDCGCFGALSVDDRVSLWSIFRNIVLLAAAGCIALLSADTPSFVASLAELGVEQIVWTALAWALTAIVVLLRAVLILGRAPRQLRSLSTRRPQREPAPLSPISLALGIDPARPGEVAMGDPIPPAELVSADGRSRLLKDLGEGRPTLLVFLSAECGNCAPVAKAVPAWRDRLGSVEVRVATSSEPTAIAHAYPSILPVTRFGSLAALAALGVQRSPAAVVLGGQQQQVIASPIAYGIVEIEALVQSVASAASV